jgi:hypothetical protein
VPGYSYKRENSGKWVTEAGGEAIRPRGGREVWPTDESDGVLLQSYMIRSEVGCGRGDVRRRSAWCSHDGNRVDEWGPNRADRRRAAGPGSRRYNIGSWTQLVANSVPAESKVIPITVGAPEMLASGVARPVVGSIR